jgi:hypothetical protein
VKKLKTERFIYIADLEFPILMDVGNDVLGSYKPLMFKIFYDNSIQKLFARHNAIDLLAWGSSLHELVSQINSDVLELWEVYVEDSGRLIRDYQDKWAEEMASKLQKIFYKASKVRAG